MKDWHITALSIVIVITGWIWMTQPGINGNSSAFAKWIIAIGFGLFSLSLYNILKNIK